MSSSPRLSGAFVPLVTPAKPDFTLDETAVARIVDSLASNGCGVFALGTTGESASLSGATRRRLVEIAVKTAAKRVKVFVGVSANCVQDSIDRANEYLGLGADGVAAHPPWFFVLSPAEQRAYFEQLARGVKGPLMIYNFPQSTRMSIPLEIVEELTRLPNIVGMKDSDSSVPRLEDTGKRFAGRPGFSIFIGVAALAVKAYRVGFDGCVPSSGNRYPKLWSDLCAHAAAGRWEEAEKLQARGDAIANVLNTGRSLGESLAALKAGLAAVNLCGAEMWPPLQALPAAVREKVAQELAPL